jgi:hypothetical protein
MRIQELVWACGRLNLFNYFLAINCLCSTLTCQCQPPAVQSPMLGLTFLSFPSFLPSKKERIQRHRHTKDHVLRNPVCAPCDGSQRNIMPLPRGQPGKQRKLGSYRLQIAESRGQGHQGTVQFQVPWCPRTVHTCPQHRSRHLHSAMQS